MKSSRKGIHLALSLVAAALVSTGCDESHRVTGTSVPQFPSGGYGPVIEQTFPVNGVDSVNLPSFGNLYIRQGATEELRVRAEEQLFDHIEVDVIGGELLIQFRSGGFQNAHPIEFHLTMTQPLRRATLTGIGRIQGSSLTTGALELVQSGLGSLDFDNLQAQSLRLSMGGMGSVTLSGSVSTQDVTVSGMADYSAGSLQSNEATVRIRKSGSATVSVRDRLDAVISGSGSVYYYGDPTVSSTITGSGRCEKLG
jgi:hypothetical protein